MTRFVVPLLLAVLLAGCSTSDGAERTAAPRAASPEAAAQEPEGRTGPLEVGGAVASCAEGYNAKTIDNRAFAFDGTIVEIGPGRTNKADKGQLDTSAVTFQVNEWFKAGTTETVTVDLMSATSSIAGDDTPAYEVGTRLLVSGEPRWGGAALDDAIAWSCGGFTRYYEQAVADEWRAATSQP